MPVQLAGDTQPSSPTPALAHRCARGGSPFSVARLRTRSRPPRPAGWRASGQWLTDLPTDVDQHRATFPGPIRLAARSSWSCTARSSGLHAPGRRCPGAGGGRSRSGARAAGGDRLGSRSGAHGPWVRDRGGLRAPAPGVRGSWRTPGGGQRLRGQHRLMPADGARRYAARDLCRSGVPIPFRPKARHRRVPPSADESGMGRPARRRRPACKCDSRAMANR